MLALAQTAGSFDATQRTCDYLDTSSMEKKQQLLGCVVGVAGWRRLCPAVAGHCCNAHDWTLARARRWHRGRTGQLVALRNSRLWESGERCTSR